MKKIVTLFLCLAMVLGIVGCSTTTTQEVEKPVHSDGYSKTWTASDTETVKHETGQLTIDDGWGSVIADGSSAGILAGAEEELYATQYTFVARLCTDGYSSTNINVVAKLRAVGEDGVELGSRTLTMRDFGADLTYKDYSFTFNVPKQQKVEVQIYWPGYEYVRVRQFALMSKSEDTADYKTGPEAILGIDQNEAVPTYDEDVLYYFDLFDWVNAMPTYADQYDIANLVATLQGLVNRDGVHLYIRNTSANRFHSDVDGYWLEYLTEDGRWLADKDVVTIKTPITLLKLFENYFTGWAVWDQSVPATVNAVATACGVDDLLPARWSSDRGSLYTYLMNYEGFAEEKPIKVDLANKFMSTDTNDKIYQSETNCTGSRKNDVYIWAKEQYLDTHKTNSHLMAYHVDAYSENNVSVSYSDITNMYLSNRDYYIAEKAFFFDLSVMEFENPNDDPDQFKNGTFSSDSTIDYKTFTAIMTAQNAYAESVDASRPIDIGGFTPWHLKYTRYTNPEASGDVDVEWETVYQFSIYYAQVNADAPSFTAMSNASIYRQYPMKDTYTQSGKFSADNPDPSEKLPSSDEQGVNYLLFYFGDFDASAWLNTAMPNFWNDPNRGKIPVAYSFSLDIYKRAGHVIDMMYETATENDYFVAGDNGTDYLNPEAFYANWRDESLNGSLDQWIAYNKKVYERFDIDVSGFLILTSRSTDEQKQEILEGYSEFSIGLGTNQGGLNNTNVNGMQIVREIDWSNVDGLAGNFADVSNNGNCTFTMVRFILVSPSDIYNSYQELLSRYPNKNFKVLDPYTFFALQEEYNGFTD